MANLSMASPGLKKSKGVWKRNFPSITAAFTNTSMPQVLNLLREIKGDFYKVFSTKCFFIIFFLSDNVLDHDKALHVGLFFVV